MTDIFSFYVDVVAVCRDKKSFFFLIILIISCFSQRIVIKFKTINTINVYDSRIEMPEYIVVDADILVVTAIFLVFPDARANRYCCFSPAWRAEAAVIEDIPRDFDIAHAALLEPIRALSLIHI